MGERSTRTRRNWILPLRTRGEETRDDDPESERSLRYGQPRQRLAEQFGIRRAPLGAVAGGDASQNAGITMAVLEGKPGPHRDVILLNAAAALTVAGSVTDLEAGLRLAAHAIDSGAALEKLRRLQGFTA